MLNTDSSSSIIIITLFWRSSPRPGVALFRMGMKMFATILSMFQSRFSGTLASNEMKVVTVCTIR